MGNNRLLFFGMMVMMTMSIWIQYTESLRCYTDLEATQVSFFFNLWALFFRPCNQSYNWCMVHLRPLSAACQWIDLCLTLLCPM